MENHIYAKRIKHIQYIPIQSYKITYPTKLISTAYHVNHQVVEEKSMQEPAAQLRWPVSPLFPCPSFCSFLLFPPLSPLTVPVVELVARAEEGSLATGPFQCFFPFGKAEKHPISFHLHHYSL